ncbi:hypothetical protein SDC9_207743 [bioreactor metagenome]|uniref:Uncharacterized protein n=1 Tax=bioreactor metagenome TaxID=1076179 RepID=A0A645JA39_9ZZZZ
MITFESALRFLASLTTARISSSTRVSLPAFKAPMLMTISTSAAPSSIAWRVSKALVALTLAPSGKPITVQTLTAEPLSRSAHRLTLQGFTHTEAK